MKAVDNNEIQAEEISLGLLLDALSGNEDAPLVVDCDGRPVKPGYHITEVKAANSAPPAGRAQGNSLLSRGVGRVIAAPADLISGIVYGPRSMVSRSLRHRGATVLKRAEAEIKVHDP